MAHDLYRKKDKVELAKSNPRSHSFGALSSGDMQYKNYLAGMKPRVKTPDKDRTEMNRTASNNFRLSVGFNDNEEDEDKIKASRALYTEMSSVPTKKTTSDLPFDKGSAPKPKPKPKMERAKSNSFDQEEKIDSVISVGKLRSMFDSPNNVTTDNVQLRNNDTNRRRDNLKRHSAFEPLQRPKPDIKKIDVKVIGKVKLDVDAMVNDGSMEDEPSDNTAPKSTLNIDAMISSGDTEINSNDKIEINSNAETKNTLEVVNNSTDPVSKTKGMHGLLQRKGSEFDDFEDRIVPTGTKTIDINSMLAPAAPADDNNNHQENITENQNEQSVTSTIDFDLQKKRELDRLIQAQQEVSIHKAFNTKRRSLKDRLSEMYTMSQQDSDVPYESASQSVEQPSINIDSHVNQSPTHIEGDNSKISSAIDTADKQCVIIDEYIVISDTQKNIDSPKVATDICDSNETSANDNKVNDISIENSLNSETIVNNNLSNVDGENESGLPVESSSEISHELNIEIVKPEQIEDSNTTTEDNTTIDNNVNIEIDKVDAIVLVDEVEELDKNNVEISKPELTDTEPEKMNILCSEPISNDSGDESEDLVEDKPYESIVDRFDAFLTSHGIADPDILSPVPISDIERDVKVLTGILDGKLETSDDLSSSFDDRLSNAGSNDLSLVDDETSKDISDNLSFADEKLSTDISDDLSLLADDKISNDISHADEVSLDYFHPVAHSSHDDLTSKSLSVKSDDEPSESLSTISTDVGDMNLMDEILGHLENKGLECNDNNDTLKNEQSEVPKSTESEPEVKLVLPNIPTSVPKISKQDKVEVVSPTQCEIDAISNETDDTSITIENETCIEDVVFGIAIQRTVDVEVTPIKQIEEHHDEAIDGVLVTESNALDVGVVDMEVTPDTHAEVEVTVASNVEVPAVEIITSSMEAPSITELPKCIESNEIMENKDIPNVIADEPILVNGTDNAASIVDVPSIENAVVESDIKKSSKVVSAHELLQNLASSDNGEAVSDQTSVSEVVTEEKACVKEEPSLSVENVTLETPPPVANVTVQPELVLEIKAPVSHKPKKSILAKGKGGGGKKVNFKDPFLNDVILTYGPTEYDRANADIDPISSSAEWELEKRVDKMDVFSVDLQKDERGLGLSIIGLGVGTESGVEKLGIFVKTLTENGASQKDGRIQVNDQILEVNGISLVGVTQYFAAQTLKNTDGVVRFLMGREKSRRSQYAPGSPLAGNPEMHKHVEEMNKVLQQLEEFEDRAINAESTLEDVKLELLKAEERAHEVERQLKDTKEQLTAVTESPFVGSTRKLKNEIKKKGGKHDKMELQRSLTDVTNRLSTSNDNLTELQLQTDNKDKQITLLTDKISDQDSQLAQTENSNKFLQNEIGCKINEINTLRLESGQLKEQLNEINDKHEKEKQNLALVQIEMAVKAQNDVDEIQSKAKTLENENKCQRDEIIALTRRLEINEQLLREVTETQDQSDQVKRLQQKINEHETEVAKNIEVNCNMQTEIETLKEKNEYLQTLIFKLERRDELVPEKLDIELKFKEKEEEYLKQNEILHAKISELEGKLRFHPEGMSPTLPIRGYVNVDEIDKPIQPPEFSRETKPSLTKEASLQLQFDLNKTDDETNLLSNDSGIESVNNIDDIEVIITDDINTSPNPVPKPERGNFITIKPEVSPNTQDDTKPFLFDHTQEIELKDIIEEPTELNYPVEIKTEDVTLILDTTLDLNVTPSITASTNIQDIPEIKDEDVKLDVGNTEEIITDKFNLSSTPVVVPGENIEKNTSSLSFDLDDLPEGKIDNDSEEDQGQFQLIQEDIEEEQQTPAPESRSIRVHSDLGDNRNHISKVNGDIDGSLTGGNFDQWLDKDWTRLDSTAREERAEMIAAEISAHAPTLRKGSSTSSTSSGEVKVETPKVDIETPLSERSHSIKIDSSYFEKSKKVDDSFDYDGSIDVNDHPVDDNIIAISPMEDVTGDLTKSLSFDSAIPPTIILDNKVALDKKAVMNNQRAKPSRSPRLGSASANVKFTEIEPTVAETQTATLPRPMHKPNNKLQAAQSVPNLSMVPDYEKPSKRKHKYVFHLPKAFKKTKLGKRFSQHESFDKKNKEAVMSLSDTDLSSNSEVQALGGEIQPPYTPSINTEADVVPMEEKTAALNQEKANDAATEEAVVPFADKEMLMTTSTSDSEGSIHIHSGESPPSIQNPLSLEIDSSPSLSSSRSLSETRQGSRDEIGSSTSSHGPQHNDGSMEIEFSSFTTSPVEGTTSPAFYNERGVDVEMTNGHSEVDMSYKNQPVTQWDVKQVGLWMAEINMNNYVNGFKLHNVDGLLLLRADGRELKEYGVHNHEHRAQIKKYIKEFRLKFGKGGSTKAKDHKSTKDKLQFWKGKYKLN